MIKVIWGRRAYDSIDEQIAKNGGVPRRCEITGELITRENWDRKQEEARKVFDAYVKEVQEEFLLDSSSNKYRC